MMAPVPVVLLVVLMIGYPLTQIIAIRLRRGKRLAFNALAARIQADPRVSRFDKNVVRRITERSRGGAGTLRTLITLPLLAFRTAAASDTDTSPKAMLYSEVIEHLWDQCIELEWAAWPITSAIVLPVALGAWALGAGFARLKGAVRPSFPTLHDLARATVSTRASAA